MKENRDTEKEAKLKMALKEIREMENWLKILIRAELIQPSTQLAPLLQ